MYVENCLLRDTKGARKCPHCGERHLQKIHTVNSQGRPLVVECPACRNRWDWPTVRDDEIRRKEAMREYSRSYYREHRGEILERQRKNSERNVRLKRERRHRKHADLHPQKVCPTCGMKFVAKHGGHKYCSEACRRHSAQYKIGQRKVKVRNKIAEEAYIKALESVAESVGKLDECRAVKDSFKRG